MHEKIEISTEFITLGQIIKLANVLESGGMIKSNLRDEGVLVNGELEHGSGSKLYHEHIEGKEGIESSINVKETQQYSRKRRDWILYNCEAKRIVASIYLLRKATFGLSDKKRNLHA